MKLTKKLILINVILLSLSLKMYAGDDAVVTFTGHQGFVRAVAFNPDSRYIATGSYDGTAKLWDVTTGKEVRKFVGHTDSITAVAFSPNGKLLATGSFDGTAKIWQVSTGEELITLKDHFDWVQSVAFSHDGNKLATGSFDGTAKLWDVKTGQVIFSFTGHKGGIYSAALSPDDRFLITGSEDWTAKLWDVTTGEEIRTFSGHQDAVLSVAFSTDGKYIATGSRDRTASVWDVITRKIVKSFSGHKGWNFAVAFSTEGRYLATGSGDKTIRLWDIKSGKPVKNFSGHKDMVCCIAFSPDGWHLASGSDDNTVKLWPIPFIPERGAPPNLYAEMEFCDENGDGILEAMESARLYLKIRNEGKGPAQRVRVNIDDISDLSLTVKGQSVRVIEPGGICEMNLFFKTDIGLRTAQHRLKIKAGEYYGYDMDPAVLILNTEAIRPPNVIFAGLEIADSGNDAAPIIEDGMLQAGEQAKLKIMIQNTGFSVARGITYSVQTHDANIYLDNNIDYLGDIKPGEVKVIGVTISPNKRVSGYTNLPIYLTIRDRIGMTGMVGYQLPLQMNVLPAKPVIASVKDDDIDQNKTLAAKFEFPSSKFSMVPNDLVDINTIEPAVTTRPNSVGIIFGIEHYNEISDDNYAIQNAELMKEYFEKRLGVDTVFIYKNNQASGLIFDEIFNPVNGKLQRLINKDQSEVFVFYAGKLVPDKKGEELLLFPSDGRLNMLAKDGYPLKVLYESLGKMGAASVTVITDAEYLGISGMDSQYKSIVKKTPMRLKFTGPKPWASLTNFTVINASDDYYGALDNDRAKLGLFTYFLASGLKGNADADGDNKVTLVELKKYVVENLTEASWKMSGLQMPEFYGEENRVLTEW